MKNLLISLLAVVLFSCTTVQSQIRDMDSVDVYTFTIKKTSTGNSIPIIASSQAVNRAFGAPTSSVQEYSELDDLTYTKWIYSGLTISFDNGQTAYFDFATTAFGLVFNNQVIKVGNDISTLSSLFPGSYAARADDRIMIELHANRVMTDARIVIVFNQNDKITRILLAQ